jgi:hypothetical protein
MNGIEKRKHARVDSTNLLNYVCMNPDGEAYTQGMGRTLNVSESGILLETYTSIDSDTDVWLTIGIEEDLVDLHGKVVYLKKSDEETYEAGIKFSEVKEDELSILKRFVEDFEKRSA